MDGGEEWEMWKGKCPERGRLDEADFVLLSFFFFFFGPEAWLLLRGFLFS